MKTMIVIIFLGLVYGISFADEVYEKVDDYTLKITTTIQDIEVNKYSMPELLTKKVRKLDEIKSNYDNYITKDIELKSELKDIEKRISQAIKLNIKEKPDAL